ncbi:MAG: DEAD/DEAH box helicase family protein [Polyangiaceae bacterium]|nr:DEAD/DEAH box helicase family protein [Polyangiaceae bacterium]
MNIDQLVSQIGLDREHQMRAVRAALEALLVRKQRGVVLADEVGCGKTYEALGIAALLWHHFRDTNTPIRRILVVAKPALMHKWFDEIEAPPAKGRGFQQYVASEPWRPFLEMLRGVTMLGRKWDGEGRGVRDGGKIQVPPDRVYLVKPLLLTGDHAGEASPMVRWLRRTDWDLIILDEAHNFTNPKTAHGRVFFPDEEPESRPSGLAGRFLLALTATPFQLATKELLNLVRIVLAPEDDIQQLGDGLARYETALNQFYLRRNAAPSEEGRRRWVERLAELRVNDASGGQRPGTPGLQQLLRRYLLRNVKDLSERDYRLTERRGESYEAHNFGKLDDLRPILGHSPLIPLEGDDAWVYLHLRDLLVDAQQAAQGAKDGNEREKPSFVAGDLRQCLSSYEQLAESAILAKALPRADQTRSVVQRLVAAGHAHPKIAALCAVVAGILDREIEMLRERPHAGFQKILVFNTLMHTAGALREALVRTVRDKVDPFVEEQVTGAGWESLDDARDMVRHALREEREIARARLRADFDPSFLRITHDLLDHTGLEMKTESRELVDVMFARAENHCTQPLFLLRMALWLKGCGEQADAFGVQTFLMKRVGDPLRRSLAAIVDDYLDDTPTQGEAFSEENQERARREIARLARVLAAPEYVARFDGRQSDEDREMRRENFNRPYAPLIMLVSRVGEEGIDLQQHTRYILHYDIEWNPAKMEQREGRVDREGRKTRGAIQVQFFLLKDTYEERVFHTVMQRDAWFQVMIGSKRQELAKGNDDDPEAITDVDFGNEERGRLTAEERAKVMIDLRP